MQTSAFCTRLTVTKIREGPAFPCLIKSGDVSVLGEPAGALIDTSPRDVFERQTVIRWKPFIHQGKVYDLAHLHPRTIVYHQAAKGDKPARSYTVNVIFGLHCFTHGFPKGGLPSDLALLYADSREQREFDFQRYELSKRLPVIIEELPCRKCFHTGKGNFFSIDMIDDQGRRIEYDIFFAASRSLKGGLNLFVQSAYVRDALHASSRPHQKPIGFLVILFNTLNNRPIKLPPK